VSDHVPMCMAAPWTRDDRLSRLHDLAIDVADVHSRIRLLNVDAWRSDEYSEQWCINWDSRSSLCFDSCLSSYLEGQPCPFTDSMNDQLGWYAECMWACAEKAGMVRKRPLPLDQEVWGVSELTTPPVALTVDDLAWLENGKAPPRLWWNYDSTTVRQR
jgi:hypothetical protein